MKSIGKLLLVCATVWSGCANMLSAENPPRPLRVVVVVGAGGTSDYGAKFASEAALWQGACEKAGVACELLGLAPEDQRKSDAAKLKTWLKAAEDSPRIGLWLVLIGHGTFDGRDARFNLRGPDLSPEELSDWLKPFTGEVAVIQTASASAPFVRALAGPNRVLISATKSADEVFYTRFGSFFAQAISGSKEPDLDQDGQVSLLEAFLWSSKEVDRFFETEERLATEHALLEDSGDGVGSRAEAFESLRSVRPPAVGQQIDGTLARQWCLLLSKEDALLGEANRKRRDELEREVELLYKKKTSLRDNEYYDQMEKLQLEIARLYQAASSR